MTAGGPPPRFTVTADTVRVGRLDGSCMYSQYGFGIKVSHRSPSGSRDRRAQRTAEARRVHCRRALTQRDPRSHRRRRLRSVRADARRWSDRGEISATTAFRRAPRSTSSTPVAATRARTALIGVLVGLGGGIVSLPGVTRARPAARSEQGRRRRRSRGPETKPFTWMLTCSAHLSSGRDLPTHGPGDPRPLDRHAPLLDAPSRPRALSPHGATPSMLPSAALAGIFVVVMAATTVSTPLYPLYEARFGLTPLAITIVFAAYGLGVMGGLLVAGRLSDHIGRRPPLAAGLVIGLVAMALFVAANGLGPLLVARLLIGVTAGLFTGTATAWLVDLDDDRQRATKVAVGANLGGLALGPALGGVLAQFAPDPLRTIYWVEADPHGSRAGRPLAAAGDRCEGTLRAGLRRHRPAPRGAVGLPARGDGRRRGLRGIGRVRVGRPGDAGRGARHHCAGGGAGPRWPRSL